MKKVTSDTFDCALMLVAGLACMSLGAGFVIHDIAGTVGWMVVFVGLVNLFHAWRMRKKLSQKKGGATHSSDSTVGLARC